MRSMLRDGEPAAVIARAIETEPPDLLVLGSRGRLGPAGAMLGGVAHSFRRARPCDILVAPA